MAMLTGMAQTAPPLPPPQPGFSFPVKQTLTYAVDWRVFPAGVATFHLEQAGGLERITATGQSTGAVNLLFPVNDWFESYLNGQTGCSTVLNKRLQKGRRQITSSLRFFFTQPSRSSTRRTS